jgi:hypothetical protein
MHTLVELIAHFEEYTDQIAGMFRELGKTWQFPENIREVRARLSASVESADVNIARAYNARLTAKAHCNPDLLEELLIVYRYAKEVRNAFMHYGGRATDKVLEAQSNFQSLLQRLESEPRLATKFGALQLGALPPNLGVSNEEPAGFPIADIAKINAVLLRLIRAFDAIAAYSSVGIDHLNETILSKAQPQKLQRNMPEKYVASLLATAGFPRLLDTALPALAGFLRRRGHT